MVSPGWTFTPLTKEILTDHSGIKTTLKTIPLRKLARVEVIASAVVFLTSDKLSGHISGQEITVAGGMEGRLLFKDEEIDITRV